MSRARGRWLFAGLVLIFALPFLAAWAALALGGGQSGAAAAGRLVRPAHDLPATPLVEASSGRPRETARVFTGHWTLLVSAPGGCRARCRAALTAGRRVRALLGADARRVRRVLLVGDNTSATTTGGLQPDVAVYRTNMQNWQKLWSTADREAPGITRLIDPAGQWMASYPPGDDGRALYDDLHRLLRIRAAH